jgi:hypothetical protein
MFLMELQQNFSKADNPWTVPASHLELLVDNRDGMMQKYGSNMVIGYMFPWVQPDNPGANRWAWATLNYFSAQLTATQHHFVGGIPPSMRPWAQFMTRYSRYVWAPDVKVVPEAEKTVSVNSPEELWWKRLVYKLKTEKGYDLIIHLVRIPPMKKWDIDWPDEPAPLDGVSVQAEIGNAKLCDAWALRPYDFEEEQQVVEKKIPALAEGSTVTAKIPPFRYHTILIIRVED